MTNQVMSVAKIIDNLFLYIHQIFSIGAYNISLMHLLSQSIISNMFNSFIYGYVLYCLMLSPRQGDHSDRG